MSKIKVFVIYHQADHLIKSDIFQPILTGAYAKECPSGMIGDHTGDNISNRNANYGELTAHYWVMKNYLPQCEEEYIGFCHYRRFLGWNINHNIKKIPFISIYKNKFEKLIKMYDSSKIYNIINQYDVILPHKASFTNTLMEQYSEYHVVNDMNNAIHILERLYPEYYPYVFNVMNRTCGYFCLNFTMRKNILLDFLEWSQSILHEIYKISDFSKYDTYATIRTPAYIIERLFNVWLEYQIVEKGINVMEVDSYLIKYKKNKIKEFITKYISNIFNQILYKHTND